MITVIFRNLTCLQSQTLILLNVKICLKLELSKYVHKTKKEAFLGITQSYENLLNVTLVYPFLVNLVSKLVKDFKEKSHKLVKLYLCVIQNYRAKYQGECHNAPLIS